MIGRGKAHRYFDINHDTGDITLKDDLRKEMDTEYQVNQRICFSFIKISLEFFLTHCIAD